MNAISVFNFHAEQSVRVVMIGDAPWFAASDVCAVLEHTNPTMAVKRLDGDEKQVIDLSALNNSEGGNINSLATIINESGLYSLILTSRKPEAKKFKRWVTHEVLPAIRKTGRYEAPTQAAIEPISRAQLNRLSADIGAIATLFRNRKTAEWHAWDLLRKLYGRKGTGIAAYNFDGCLCLLRTIHDQAAQFSAQQSETELKFIGRWSRGLA